MLQIYNLAKSMQLVELRNGKGRSIEKYFLTFVYIKD